MEKNTNIIEINEILQLVNFKIGSSPKGFDVIKIHEVSIQKLFTLLSVNMEDVKSFVNLRSEEIQKNKFHKN